MTPSELNDRMMTGDAVPLSADEWDAVAGDFEVLERHDTLVAGDLLVVATEHGPAAVERPRDDQRVVRLLGNDERVKSFVARRMAEYERMWDGCGCRIDYLS